MLVVEEGAPPSADVDGSILVTRNTSEGNGEKCVQFFGSAYSCRRSAFHEDQTRLEELALLTRLESDIQRLHSAVGLITKETPVNKKGDTIEKANNTLLECERALHACQNKYKKTIRNIADEMPDLTIIRKHDKRRIFNPSGCMAKMLKALRMIKERLGEMRPLNHFNADDHHDLSVQIKRDEEAMSKFVNTVLSKSNGVEACVNDNALSHDTVNIISDSLQTESLQQVRLRPNRTFAQAILDEMRKAIHYCRNDDNPNKPQIRRHLATVNIIGKLWGVSHVFENFRDQIVSNGDINGENGDYFQSIADAKTLIVRLRKVFDERQLFSEVTVIKWVGPCEAMMQGFADIERGLEIYMKRDFDENGHEVERLAMFQRLTEFMDQFDIEKIVQGGWMDESGEDE
jgi:hypothetical protein